MECYIMNKLAWVKLVPLLINVFVTFQVPLLANAAVYSQPPIAEMPHVPYILCPPTSYKRQV
jgi:hypothetical protein